MSLFATSCGIGHWPFVPQDCTELPFPDFTMSLSSSLRGGYSTNAPRLYALTRVWGVLFCAVWQGSVYVADFEAKARRVTTPRHLTMHEGRDYPAAWTADSKAIVFGSSRDGQWGIFRQSLDADTALVIVTGLRQKDVVSPRVSPDGAWVLYPELPSARVDLRFLSNQSTIRVPLMRLPPGEKLHK